jgi:hypothetical protein
LIYYMISLPYKFGAKWTWWFLIMVYLRCNLILNFIRGSFYMQYRIPLLPTDYYVLITDYWLLTTDYWPLTTDYWPLITDHWPLPHGRNLYTHPILQTGLPLLWFPL